MRPRNHANEMPETFALWKPRETKFCISSGPNPLPLKPTNLKHRDNDFVYPFPCSFRVETHYHEPGFVFQLCNWEYLPHILGQFSPQEKSVKTTISSCGRILMLNKGDNHTVRFSYLSCLSEAQSWVQARKLRCLLESNIVSNISPLIRSLMLLWWKDSHKGLHCVGERLEQV